MSDTHTPQAWNSIYEKELSQIRWKFRLIEAVMASELSAVTVLDILDRLGVRAAEVADKEIK